MDRIRNLLKKHKAIEFIRFCIVGCIAALIDVGIFNVVLFFTNYLISTICGFAVSWVANYILSTYWTFKEKPNTKNFFGVLISHLINLFLVRMGLMYIFVDVLSLNDRIAYVPTLLLSAITSFLMVKTSYVLGHSK